MVVPISNFETGMARVVLISTFKTGMARVVLISTFKTGIAKVVLISTFKTGIAKVVLISTFKTGMAKVVLISNFETGIRARTLLKPKKPVNRFLYPNECVHHSMTTRKPEVSILIGTIKLNWFPNDLENDKPQDDPDS